jgi:hypothetical protein
VILLARKARFPVHALRERYVVEWDLDLRFEPCPTIQLAFAKCGSTDPLPDMETKLPKEGSSPGGLEGGWDFHDQPPPGEPITGNAQADATLLMSDAINGLSDQTRGHAHLLHFLGLHQMALIVNKTSLITAKAGLARSGPTSLDWIAGNPSRSPRTLAELGERFSS